MAMLPLQVFAGNNAVSGLLTFHPVYFILIADDHLLKHYDIDVFRRSYVLQPCPGR